MKLKSKNKKKKAKKAAPYVRRTLEDERVHRHLSDAAAALSKAYRRAARQPGAKAVEDKKLYANVRGAAASLRAALGIVSEPEPEPPKRLKRKALTVLIIVGTVGFAAKKVAARRGGDDTRDYSAARPSGPVEPARAAQAA
jgi:uncharacterized membrane protein YccC